MWLHYRLQHSETSFQSIICFNNAKSVKLDSWTHIYLSSFESKELAVIANATRLGGTEPKQDVVVLMICC